MKAAVAKHFAAHVLSATEEEPFKLSTTLVGGGSHDKHHEQAEFVGQCLGALQLQTPRATFGGCNESHVGWHF
eukprot:5627076-Amphidinium_carterae.1